MCEFLPEKGNATDVGGGASGSTSRKAGEEKPRGLVESLDTSARLFDNLFELEI